MKTYFILGLTAMVVGAGLVGYWATEPRSTVNQRLFDNAGVAAWHSDEPQTIGARGTVRSSAADVLVVRHEKESISDIVSRLVRTGKPRDAYEAYLLVHRCLNDRQLKSPLESTSQCDALSPGQIASRIDWLQVAASAGVPGAFLSLIDEGPAGTGFVGGTAEDLKNPVVSAFFVQVQRAMEAAARSGDIQAIQLLSNQAALQNDKPEALKYWIAQQQVAAARGLDTTRETSFISAISSELTLPEVESARRLGSQIAAAAQASVYWNNK